MAYNIFSTDSPLLPGADQNLVNENLYKSGMFTPDTNVPVSDNSGVNTFNAAVGSISNAVDQYKQSVATQQQNAVLAQMARQKQQQLLESQRLQSLSQYRKDPLKYNPDGTLAQDSDAEILLKQGLNKVADWWNDITPSSLNIESRLTGTVAGMQHEDLGNKNIIGTEGMTKQDVINEVNSMQDNPNGKGTLYYLKKNIGTDDNPNYIYKVGFAALDAADRYRAQAGFAGWQIVKEVQNSDTAKVEADVHAMNMDSRLLSYGTVKDANGNIVNHDKASGINFGAGYGEIYNKDILGWDQQKTQQDVDNYKQTAVQQAITAGYTPTQIQQLNNNLDFLTPDNLSKIQYADNLSKSIAKRNENDTYTHTHYKSDPWTGFKVGLDTAFRQGADATLDAITPAGLSKDSLLGGLLESDGQGNSQLLDKYKSDEQIANDFHYNSRKSAQAVDSFVQHTKEGNYFAALGDVFSKDAVTFSANNIGYFAPVIVGSVVGSVLSGGTADVGAAVGFASKIKSAYQAVTEASTAVKAAEVTGNAEAAVTAGVNLNAAQAAVQSSMRGYGSVLQSAGKLASNLGFYGEAVAMTNERIDQRIKNNGGQPTSLLDNGAVFMETVLENTIDKYMNLETLGIAGRTELQSVYKALEVSAQKNIMTSAATKAIEIAATSGLEGATEYIQNIGQAFAEQYDTKKNGGTIEGILNSKENQEDNLVNFLMGAATGIHMQILPTAGRTVIAGAKAALYNSPLGGKAYDTMLRNKQNLIDSVVAGSANPYDNSTTPYSGSTVYSTKNDIYNIATHPDELPMQVAKYAIFGTQADVLSEPQNSVDSNGNTVPGTKTDANIDAANQSVSYKTQLNNTVKGINSSLRATYNMDNNPSPTEESQYRNGIYTSALNAMKHVVYYDQTVKSLKGSENINIDATRTQKSLSNVIDAYNQYLSPDDKAQVQLLIGNEILNHMKSQASKINPTDKSVDLTGSKILNKDYSLKIDELYNALSSIETLRVKMGSMDNGTHPGGSKNPGTNENNSEFIEGAQSAIDNFYAQLKGAYTKAQEDGVQDVQLTQAFFDKAKTFSQVGSEILLYGKSNADGTTNGSGILQHGRNIINEISRTANNPSTNKTSLISSAAGSAKSFSDKMLRIHDMKDRDITRKHESDLGNMFTDSDIRNMSKEDGTSANYIPQLDITGRIVKSKLFEAQMFKKEIEKAKGVLQSYIDSLENESKKDTIAISAAKNYMVIIDNIINTQDKNTATLTTYLDDNTRLSKYGRVLEDITKNKQYKNVVDAIRNDDNSENRFKKGSIYAFVEKLYKGGSKHQDIFTTEHNNNVKDNSNDDNNSWHDGETTHKPIIDEHKPAKSTVDGTTHDISNIKDESSNNKENNNNGDSADGQNVSGSQGQSEPRENSKTTTSSENAKNDEQKSTENERNGKRTEGLNKHNFTPVEEFKDSLLEQAKKQVEQHHNEAIKIINEIAVEAGITDFKYNTDENIAYNIKEIRKVITRRVNETKKSVRKDFLNTFNVEAGKVESLSLIIDNAIAKDEIIRSSIALKNQPELKEHNDYIRKVERLKNLIETNTKTNDLKKLKANLSSLSRLLAMPIPDNIKQKIIPYFKSIKDALENNEHIKDASFNNNKYSASNIKELDEINKPSQQAINELNEAIAKVMKEEQQPNIQNTYNIQPEPQLFVVLDETENNVESDIEDDTFKDVEGSQFISQNDIDQLFDKDITNNIFETEESKLELKNIRNKIFAKQKELLDKMSSITEAMNMVTDAHNSMDSGLSADEQRKLFALYTQRIQDKNNSELRNCK